MKKIIPILFILISINFQAQEKELNLSFEKTENKRPLDWKDFGSSEYTISVDSTIYHSGKKSAVIESNGEASDFKAWAYSIPAKYQGKKIKLTGYIKTENVTDGYAGLWMRIDPSVGFDNMNDRGIKGTTDWKQYEITLDLNPQNAQKIVIGGLLVGKGKMWIDNLNVTIDGKTLDKVPARELPPAEKDKEFDKGSKIVINELNEQRLTNLELLGKVWGFLKYHHPAVAEGKHNWDYELFRVLPEYLNASKDNRDAILIKWIDALGSIKDCKSCKETDPDAFLKPDIKWITEGNISLELKEKLLYIKQNRHQGAHYYVAMYPRVGNPEFKHEKYYENMPYPDQGFRLLTLYKYWNMIHYFFPNKHLTDKDWNTVLKSHISSFMNAKNELEYELAAVKLIGEIQDTHANLWGGNNEIEKWKGEFYPPVNVRFIEDLLVIDDFFNSEHRETTGLKEGDIITTINGKKIADIIKEVQPYYPASNYPTQLRDIAEDILRSNSKTIQLTYIRDTKELNKELTLYDKNDLDMYRWYRKDENGKSFKMLDGNIGYVTLKNIKDEDVKKIREQFKDTKGIIIDIRNYPSAFVPFSLGSFFTSKDVSFVKFSNGNINNPGEFTLTKPLNISGTNKSYKGKLVILLNEYTQSSAEYQSMAFRAGENTTIIGSTTAGADGNISAIQLPGRLRTMISGIGVYYPNGDETQRVGIIPDIECKPTIKGIKDGKDELLEKAIQHINQK
ncbi:S41 family peptidase [uncultured Aquimarina sp.]|uniref:S41 family peptidase n=1 Tax=uncultured Aquimarina sp. TaxID=575652 RepID=UPI0026311BB0|nr:S41 family peptidase [uncultured Aquimarina sp.]